MRNQSRAVCVFVVAIAVMSGFYAMWHGPIGLTHIASCVRRNAHVLRNAMLIVVSGFPGAFISAFFTGSLLIESIFSLDGLGLLSFESIVNRDYPVVFANLYIFSLLGLVVNLLSDLTYMWIDPRIDFETREA